MRTKQQLQHLGERHSHRPWKKGKGPRLSTIWVCSNYSVTVFRKILEIYHQYVWLQTTRVKGREQKWLLVRNELLYQQGSSIKSAPHISFWSRRLTNNGPKWRLNVRNMRDARLLQRNDDFLIPSVMMYSERERDAFTVACSFSFLSVLHSVILFALSLYVFRSSSDRRYCSLALEKIYMVEKQSALTVRTVKQWHYVAPQSPSYCVKAIAYFALVVHMIALLFSSLKIYFYFGICFFFPV